jgi:signal transduction histidine kinase
VALLALVGGGLLSLTVVGVLGTPAFLVLVRAVAQLERYRCALILPAAPAVPYRAVDNVPGRAGLWATLRARLRDPATWRDLLWLALAWPVELVCLSVVVALWACGLGLASIPVWYRFLPGGEAKLYESGGVAHGVLDSVPAALPWAALGLVLVWLAGWSTRVLAVAAARLAGALLRPTRTVGLRGRVATLSSTRAAAVAGQRRELHRIERNLHDGAQARLVALSADLGLAGEAFEDDPAQARQLVEQARDGVVLALGELRDLVRGIGPPVLLDRGLAAALEGVAARSPIPVTASIVLPRRPPGEVETAAYFVVCECLANAAKHSHADRLMVDLHEDQEGCVVTVSDDGRGGADPNGTGLRGLADRVAALDGVLSVHSPAGGPTTIHAVLPCGW